MVTVQCCSVARQLGPVKQSLGVVCYHLWGRYQVSKKPCFAAKVDRYGAQAVFRNLDAN